MKKDFRKKLVLNKETIANLEIKEMNRVYGGITGPQHTDCCNTEADCTRPKFCESLDRRFCEGPKETKPVCDYTPFSNITTCNYPCPVG